MVGRTEPEWVGVIHRSRKHWGRGCGSEPDFGCMWWWRKGLVPRSWKPDLRHRALEVESP